MSLAGASADQPHRRLGRYELFREIAAGGMAKVWLARATGPGGFDKLVALKVIQPELARDRSAIEMFLDEARLAARIEHPNVCPVFDFGSADGRYFLAMEYLQGEPLSRVLKELSAHPDKLSDPRVLLYMARVIADACEGLHFAHELSDEKGRPLSVVHRDVSPHNLFLTYSGALRVVDFGIADALGKQHRTLTGVVKGKVAYMSPEQLDAVQVDRRTDVWALGVTLWELLACSRLFKRDSDGATLTAVLRASIPPPSSVRHDIPPELDAIVMRALQRPREQRYATTREMGRDLARYIASRGEAVGVPELADWMSELFAADREQKRRLVDEARGAVPAPAAPAGTAPADPTARAEPAATRRARPVRPPETSSTEATRTEVPAGPVAEAAGDGTASGFRARGSLPSESIQLPMERRARWVWPLAALGFLGGGLAVWLIAAAFEGDPTEVEHAAVAPVELEVPEPPAAEPPAPVPVEAQAPPTPARTQTRTQPRTRTQTRTQPPPRTQTPPRTRTQTPPRTQTQVQAQGPATEPDRPAPPVDPAPREEDRTPATLDVATPGGWAEVRVDGAPHGRTPTRLSLPPGSHRLELLPFGNGPAVVQTVRLSPGGRGRVVVTIDPVSSPP